TEGEVGRKLAVAYKSQYPEVEFEGTVGEWLRGEVPEFGRAYRLEVLGPLGVEQLLDRDISNLSGGELQRTVIAGCLGQTAELYLLDEPSAYLDVEQRLSLAKAVRRVIEGRGVAAFVVDHDVLAVDYMADRLLVFRGEPGRRGEGLGPLGMRDGMNLFLREVGVTFRRDPQTGRPRANKPRSRLDRDQKRKGEYYYI
ncbi:MAG: ATP-binding cassette domain-containing protein, partial [Candidatus Hadarchaeota archaeon]|nr:ATP-binding cassette domain-containing protein [Candidatus Hadarchaeota archaeon]